MDETTVSLQEPVKDWELDPTKRTDARDPDDLARWLEKYTAYRAQLRRCKDCPLLGRGAICAAELKLPDLTASTLLMITCEAALKQGYSKPMHGRAELRTRAIGSRMLESSM